MLFDGGGLSRWSGTLEVSGVWFVRHVLGLFEPVTLSVTRWLDWWLLLLVFLTSDIGLTLLGELPLLLSFCFDLVVGWPVFLLVDPLYLTSNLYLSCSLCLTCPWSLVTHVSSLTLLLSLVLLWPLSFVWLSLLCLLFVLVLCTERLLYASCPWTHITHHSQPHMDASTHSTPLPHRPKTTHTARHSTTYTTHTRANTQTHTHSRPCRLPTIHEQTPHTYIPLTTSQATTHFNTLTSTCIHIHADNIYDKSYTHPYIPTHPDIHQNTIKPKRMHANSRSHPAQALILHTYMYMNIYKHIQIHTHAHAHLHLYIHICIYI